MDPEINGTDLWTQIEYGYVTNPNTGKKRITGCVEQSIRKAGINIPDSLQIPVSVPNSDMPALMGELGFRWYNDTDPVVDKKEKLIVAFFIPQRGDGHAQYVTRAGYLSRPSWRDVWLMGACAIDGLPVENPTSIHFNWYDIPIEERVNALANAYETKRARERERARLRSELWWHNYPYRTHHQSIVDSSYSLFEFPHWTSST